jgi:site-specific DNA-methyltransferase (adenine-specific)
VENLTESKKRAYRILDNKLQNDSEWELDNLKLELAMLEDEGFELEPWGLESLLPEDPVPEVVEDDFEAEEPTDVYIKTGDLIELGEHRVLCGDSTSSLDVERLCVEKVDMILTDPPYGVKYTGKTKNALTIQNDELSEEELGPFVKAAFDNAQAVCRGGAYWYATVPSKPVHLLFAQDWKDRGVLRQIMVWVKDSMVLGRSEYHYQHEPILFGWIPGDRHVNADRTRTTVWDCPRPKSSREHPTMKPLSLWARAIQDGSREGERVFDPFLGSGTTLIAAEQSNRRCYGMELDPKYCQVILERYKAYCEKEGKPFVCRINGEAFDGNVRA